MEWHSLAWVSLSKEPLRQDRSGGVPFFLMLAIRGTRPSLTCRHGGRVRFVKSCLWLLVLWCCPAVGGGGGARVWS